MYCYLATIGATRCTHYTLDWDFTTSDSFSFLELWARAKQRSIELEIRQRKWGWLGHTLCRPPGDIVKAALEWNPEAYAEQHGTEQSFKRLDIKTKQGKKSKYSPKTVSDGETL